MEKIDNKQNILEKLDSVQALFQKEQRLQLWMDIETALSEIQADMGIIPIQAAKDIAKANDISNIDIEKYDEMYEKIKHPLVPLLKLFQKAIGPSGEYLHVGATTQDIVDMAKMVSMQRVWKVTGMVLLEILRDLTILIKKYAGTPMAGRSHNVQALPISFGFKVSVWADEIERHIERLNEIEKRVFVATFSGANGTYASFNGMGKKIEEGIAIKFNLSVPSFPWHPSRDRFAEIACTFAIIAESLSKIAQEVYMLMATEIGELQEGFQEGQVGSSTMPHKINPMTSQKIMGDAKTIRYAACQCMEDMCVDHEHNLIHFFDERITIERIGSTMCDLLWLSYGLIHNIQVNETHMTRNLNALHGCMMSENLMLELGKHIGKMTAKDIITELSIRAVRNEESLAEILKADERVSSNLSDEKIDELLKPDSYVQSATELALEKAGELEKKFF